MRFPSDENNQSHNRRLGKKWVFFFKNQFQNIGCNLNTIGIEPNQSHKTILRATEFGFSQVLRILVGLVSSKLSLYFLGTTGVGIVETLQTRSQSLPL
jgi:hypothetical protein